MRTKTKPVEVLDRIVTGAIERGLLHRVAENDSLDGRKILLGGQELIHFGSCSYLGLELDPRLKQGAADAAARYGTHFSSSRAYLSARLYTDLEELLEQIFDASVVVTPTTTLAHLAALPILCEEEDALILDHQAHNSLRMAANQVRAQGAHVEKVQHNRMDLLEERIDELRQRCRRIWYAADGIYSMYGDLAPVETLVELLERYEQLHLYLDDAHGISWCGRHGRGYVLDHAYPHERLVVATTLAKSFGTGGAVLVFHNREWRRKVQTCGGPMIFSGPISPPVMGAAIASARIHLSHELVELQKQIRERIALCNDLLLHHGLPLVAATELPLRYGGMSAPDAAQNLVAKLMTEGFFTNIAVYPAVAMDRAGVRFTLTLHHTLDDIRALIETMARELPEALAAEGTSLDEVRRAFQLPAPGASHTQAPVPRRPAPLRLQHERSITAISAEDWDRWLGDRGSFAWQGMAFLERMFQGNTEAENNWEFHYYIVRDDKHRPVLATFFTEAIWKDDMLASEAASRVGEERRLEDPYYLTSKVFSMGSLLTEGNHLYLDRTCDWRAAMSLLLDFVARQAESSGAKTVALRDLLADDPDLDAFLSSRGFMKTAMPESMVVDLTWATEEEFLQTLTPGSRRHQRRRVLLWNSAYDVEVLGAGTRRPDVAELAHLYRLYRNVHSHSLALNTFPLPEDFFGGMLEFSSWELLLLRAGSELGGGDGDNAVAVVACFIAPEHYVPLVMGMDYRYVYSHGLYRQCLRQVLLRAQQHGLRQVRFGMGASLEKHRFGARPWAGCLYVQAQSR